MSVQDHHSPLILWIERKTTFLLLCTTIITFVHQLFSMSVIEKVSCLIIGSGPAGYTAAIYASRANLNPVLYQGIQPGGQLTITTEVENYPGYPEGVQGPEMMVDFEKQAKRMGADIRFGLATKVDFSGSLHKVWIDEEKEIHADTVIIATGASAKWLGLESEQRLNGYGVSACAVCDGFFPRKRSRHSRCGRYSC